MSSSITYAQTFHRPRLAFSKRKYAVNRSLVGLFTSIRPLVARTFRTFFSSSNPYRFSDGRDSYVPFSLKNVKKKNPQQNEGKAREQKSVRSCRGGLVLDLPRGHAVNGSAGFRLVSRVAAGDLGGVSKSGSETRTTSDGDCFRTAEDATRRFSNSRRRATATKPPADTPRRREERRPRRATRPAARWPPRTASTGFSRPRSPLARARPGVGRPQIDCRRTLTRRFLAESLADTDDDDARGHRRRVFPVAPNPPPPRQRRSRKPRPPPPPTTTARTAHNAIPISQCRFIVYHVFARALSATLAGRPVRQIDVINLISVHPAIRRTMPNDLSPLIRDDQHRVITIRISKSAVRNTTVHTIR